MNVDNAVKRIKRYSSMNNHTICSIAVVVLSLIVSAFALLIWNVPIWLIIILLVVVDLPVISILCVHFINRANALEEELCKFLSGADNYDSDAVESISSRCDSYSIFNVALDKRLKELGISIDNVPERCKAPNSNRVIKLPDREDLV